MIYLWVKIIIGDEYIALDKKHFSPTEHKYSSHKAYLQQHKPSSSTKQSYHLWCRSFGIHSSGVSRSYCQGHLSHND